MNKQPNPSTCVVPPSGGRVIRAFGDEITLHLGGAETGGKYTRTSGGTTGQIDESVYVMAADNGSNFRIVSCQYVYNLSASALGVGTYRVDIKIDGQVVGSGIFQLK